MRKFIHFYLRGEPSLSVGAQTVRASRRLRAFWSFWALMIVFMSAVDLRQTLAEVASTPPPSSPAQGATARRGTATISVNLRAFPSMQSDVVGIAKQGTSV